jgi:cell volume regulation protein A
MRECRVHGRRQGPPDHRRVERHRGRHRQASAAIFALARPALPRPLAETGTIRGLGAEVVEYVVGDGDAIAGLRVREFGLPREALVSVIVRGDEAIPPRGSTRVEAGDRLHVLVRQEVAPDFEALIEHWRGSALR